MVECVIFEFIIYYFIDASKFICLISNNLRIEVYDIDIKIKIIY